MTVLRLDDSVDLCVLLNGQRTSSYGQGKWQVAQAPQLPSISFFFWTLPITGKWATEKGNQNWELRNENPETGFVTWPIRPWSSQMLPLSDPKTWVSQLDPTGNRHCSDRRGPAHSYCFFWSFGHTLAGATYFDLIKNYAKWMEARKWKGKGWATGGTCNFVFSEFEGRHEWFIKVAGLMDILWRIIKKHK